MLCMPIIIILEVKLNQIYATQYFLLVAFGLNNFFPSLCYTLYWTYLTNEVIFCVHRIKQSDYTIMP